MAFPTIPTVAAGRVLSNTQANGTAARTFPSLTGLTKNSGDLLIAICVVYQSSASGGAVFSSWGGGFTEFLDVGGTTSNMSIGAAYKYSTGSETGTFTVTQAATVTGHAAMFLLSIPGTHPSIIPVGGAIANGTAAAANIAALNPSTWGTLDTLWIAVGGSGATSAAGAFTGITAAPTNYTGYVDTGVSLDDINGVEAAVAFRQLNAASEDPATFTVDTSNARNSALLLAICPAPTRVTIIQAQELDSPQTVAAAPSPNFVAITRATETDAVGVIVPLQALPATETVFAHPFSSQSGHGITTATTTASAQALNVDKAITVTLVSETDTAVTSGITQKTLVLVSETDQAQGVSVTTHVLVPATETDLVGEIVPLQTLPALETDSPQVLVFTQSDLFPVAATETAQAQLLSFTQGGGHGVAPATETDLAGDIIPFQPLPATETSSALTLDFIAGGRNISPVVTTNSAVSIAPQSSVTLTQFEVTAPLPYNSMAVTIGDRSTAVALSVTFGSGPNKTILPATETDSAGGSGPELLPNGSFEDSPGDAHWDTFGTMSMQSRTYAQEPTVPVLSGSALLLVEANANLDGITTEPDEWIVVSPLRQYTLSVWFYSAVPFVPNIALNEYTASSLPVAGSATGGAVPANTWTRQTLTITTNALTERLEVRIYLGSGAPVEFYIDSVSLTLAGGAPLIPSKRVPLTTVTTTASAQALALSKSYNITTANATASAVNLTYFQDVGTFYSIDLVSETDTATSIGILKEIFMTLGIVTTVNIARLTRAANRPSGGLALVDHEPDSGLSLTDHTQIEDLVFTDI